MRDRFNMFRSRPKTIEERLAELRRQLDMVSRASHDANEENGHLRRMLDDADKKRRDAENRARQTDCLRVDAMRELESLRLKNIELQTMLDNMLKLKNDLATAEAEIKKLRKKLNIREGRESPFGLSTSSGKEFVKKNSSEENMDRKGGAVKGHKGHCRRTEEADGNETEILVPSGKNTCCRGENLALVRTHTDVVTRYVPGYFRKKLCTYGIFRCRTCGTVVNGRIRDTFPGMKYDMGALAEAMKLAYEDFLPYGLIAKRMGINKGTLLGMLDRMAVRFGPLYGELKKRIVEESFLHADETSWRTDGHNGYVWLFTNDRFRLFLFRDTRSASVPREVLGKAPESLVLITDRYAGYSSLNVRHQYCYVHLMRDLKKMLEDDPDNNEVRSFANAMLDELKSAVALQGNKGLSDAEYARGATKIKSKIMGFCNGEAQDGAVRGLQDLFREKEECLFQWVEDRRVPCHNNNAERRLRPVVIARKISMGCQSAKGRTIREVLGSIVQTAVARGKDVTVFLMECMRRMLEAPDEKLYQLLC